MVGRDACSVIESFLVEPQYVVSSGLFGSIILDERGVIISKHPSIEAKIHTIFFVTGSDLWEDEDCQCGRMTMNNHLLSFEEGRFVKQLIYAEKLEQPVVNVKDRKPIIYSGTYGDIMKSLGYNHPDSVMFYIQQVGTGLLPSSKSADVLFLEWGYQR